MRVFTFNYINMKSINKIKGIAALALLLGLAAAPIVQAQDITIEAGTDAQIEIRPLPIDERPVPQRAAQIKANIENRLEANKDARNALLEKKQEMRMELKADARMEKREQASASIMFKRDKRGAVAKKMEARAFEVRKAALLKLLTNSLENQTDIAARIESRIEKAEASGRTMTEARALLVTANEKHVKATAAVEALAALTPATSTVTASTTVEADLAKPRQVGDAAIKAVKESRDAYQKVVVAIAHNMGLKNEANASTTVEVQTGN